MDASQSLLHGFAAAAPPTMVCPADDVIVDRLLDSWERATTSWPAIDVEPETFNAALASRLDPAASFDDALASVDVAEPLEDGCPADSSGRRI